MSSADQDDELLAIQKLVSALEPLDEKARSRVISYVFERLGIGASDSRHSFEPPEEPGGVETGSAPPQKNRPGQIHDIRTLAIEKAPKTANEKAAVVAYYLKELAPENERKNEITTADITKYFKQAGMPLPAVPRNVLFFAKNAGYLDSTAQGKYTLNPVGHNLVVHSLPASSTAGRSSSTRGKKGRKRKGAGQGVGTKSANKKAAPKKRRRLKKARKT